MGIYILSGGSRDEDSSRLSRKRLSSLNPSESKPAYEPPLPPNPDPLRFTIERVKETGPYLAGLIHYPDCTNYEGRKIIVFEGLTETKLRSMKYLDPHFFEGGPVMARFQPDESGWENALQLMRTLSQ